MLSCSRGRAISRLPPARAMRTTQVMEAAVGKPRCNNRELQQSAD